MIDKCGRANRPTAPPKKLPTAEHSGAHSMTFYRTHHIALVVAVGISAMALSASPTLAFDPDAQQMCAGDAMRLCGNEIPNIPRIIACMHRQRAQVSPGCRAVMDREAAAAARRRAAAE